MTALQTAGYVATSKSGRGRGATTTFRITDGGVRAYDAHRTALRAILADE